MIEAQQKVKNGEKWRKRNPKETEKTEGREDVG